MKQLNIVHHANSKPLVNIVDSIFCKEDAVYIYFEKEFLNLKPRFLVDDSPSERKDKDSKVIYTMNHIINSNEVLEQENQKLRDALREATQVLDKYYTSDMSFETVQAKLNSHKELIETLSKEK